MMMFTPSSRSMSSVASPSMSSKLFSAVPGSTRVVSPEAGENARELDGDVTADHHRDAPRALAELEEAAE